MNKFFISCFVIVKLMVYADNNHLGYIVSGFGEPIKTGYGDCLHSSYFNKNNHIENSCEHDNKNQDDKEQEQNKY